MRFEVLVVVTLCVDVTPSDIIFMSFHSVG